MTNGRYPTQEEVMMFVMSGMAMGGGMMATAVDMESGTMPAQTGHDGQFGYPESQGLASDVQAHVPGAGDLEHGGSDAAPYGSQSWNGKSNVSNVNEGPAVSASPPMSKPTPAPAPLRQVGNGPTSIVDAVIAEHQNGASNMGEGEEVRGKAGKMIKIGDRWKWVKGDTEG